MNFFVQANNNPQIIVDFLSCYANPEDDIEREIIQLVYYGKLSYIDVNVMNFHKRRFWLKELRKMIDIDVDDSMVF